MGVAPSAIRCFAMITTFVVSLLFWSEYELHIYLLLAFNFIKAFYYIINFRPH